MSSYGHPRSYGPSGYGEPEGYDSYDGYADSYASESHGTDPYPAPRAARPTPTGRAPAGQAPAGRAAAGRASAGRARVAGSAAVAPPEPATSPANGSPPETRPAHRYDWSGAGAQRPAAGRASVPVSPAVGGTSGRATVRPAGPTKPGGPAGIGPGDGGEGRPKPKKKRHWLRNSLLCTLAVMIITVGGGMVALSYYVDSVPPPELTPLAEGSTIRYADGKEMAVLQEVNREIIDTKIPELENVRTAVVAAEDKTFYDHSGVDFQGIVRAAWNNFTGGEQQGASTIDQQYAGAAANIRGDNSYSRKLREAAMAYKMNQDLSKEEILDFYLNTIYFGRGAYGVQAAAEAYYGKNADELTLEEAAVMAGAIRLPDDGTTLSPYDPLHADGPDAAELRFDYVLGQVVEMGKLDQATADAMVLPEVIEPRDPKEPLKGAQGPIVNQIQQELERMGITDVTTGGYQITTTIDREMQKAARDSARRRGNDGPLWEGMPENVAAAMVSIDPATGGVLAYYGGENGDGFDLAGLNVNQETGAIEGGREPGSTMKIYTLMAGLREGVALDTKWKTSEFTPPWRDKPVTNAGRVAGDCEGDAPDNCTLRWSTIQSFNTPFIHLSAAMEQEGPANILQAAMDAGVRTITDNEGVTHDLTELESASEVAPEHIFHEVAIGQYAITVLDHASGVATLAARGVYHEPHFVAKVEKRENGEWVPVGGDQIAGEQRIETAHADAITGVLSQVPNSGMMGNNFLNNRTAAAKTGTWEYINSDGVITGNKDAWVVGYTPHIATAVWVGDPEGGPIVDQFGGAIGSDDLPAQIWKQFMDDAHQVRDFPSTEFPQTPQVGDPNHRYANGVAPEPEDDDNALCRGPVQLPFCEDDDDDDDDDENNGGGGGNNGGGLIPLPPPGGQQDQGG